MSTSIHLTSEQQQTLTRLAESRAANGTPTETVQAAMVRLGLLGCVTDGPADLSANPAYMEGFGSHGG